MTLLFQFNFQKDHYAVIYQENNQRLLINDRAVSSTTGECFSGEHRFSSSGYGPMRLRFTVQSEGIQYWLETPNQLLAHGQAPALCTDELQTAPVAHSGAAEHSPTEQSAPVDKPQRHTIALLALFFKLIKSAGAMKAALAGTALAGWAWLFNLEFAVCLIAALFVHEFGHVLAMRQSGLKVKGIYLIPFIGGVAVSEASTSRWQDFKISMAGPAFGCLGALAGWVIWLITDSSLAAMFAVVSLLINLFNLLPIVPLDGGQAIKAMAFSKPGKIGKGLLLALNAVLVAAALQFGFHLLVFFGFLGALDLIFSDDAKRLNQRPMSNYAIGVSAFMYFALIGLLAGLSVSMAASGLEGANLPLIFLSS